MAGELPEGLNEDLLKKTCHQAFKAHKSPEKYFLVEKNSSEIIISFSGSWNPSDWFTSKPFGEANIDLKLFPSLRSIGNDEAALVNKAFLQRFDSILKDTALESEVIKALKEKKQIEKQIVFTGHSYGGAIAILATFWTLEKYFNPTETQNHKLPFCVTFGSPLVGNYIFSHAARRENWSSYFIHMVTKFDIVPRISLAPFSAIEPKFGSILELLNPKNKSSTIGRANEAADFYWTVMRNAATVASHAACNLMGNTNLLLETVTNFIDLSPYRPFGTYIFFTGNGKLIVVRNSDAVLQLLFYSAQLSDLAEVSDVANKSILQHLAYEDELKDSLEMLNVVYLDKLEELPLSASADGFATINVALNDLGLSPRARLCLRAAGELERQKSKNEEKIAKEIEKAEASMRDLESYKATSDNKGYYDAFKVQKETRDFHANVKRLVLAGAWDEIIEMLKRYELPDEFEGKIKWIRLGTSFRRLVEPLDIANYYRHLKNEDTGPYIIKARPKRYRYTQRWSEHNQRVPKAEFCESSFWAEVEELCSNANKKKPFEEVKGRVEHIEQEIKKWTDKGDLLRDVFTKDSTFVNWWKNLPMEHRATSCIASFFNM